MAITIEPLPLPAVAALLATEPDWQQLFAEVARFAPPHAAPADVLGALVAHHQIAYDPEGVIGAVFVGDED
jgi:hypothetical protein